MYGIVLAASLAVGPAAPAYDGVMGALEDLKRQVDDLRKEQQEFRVEGLKQIIAALRQKRTEDQLDEIRRMVEDLRSWRPTAAAVAPRVVAPRALRMPPADRAFVSMVMPPGATLVVGDREIVLTSTTPTFVTPPLTPGKDYSYTFKVTAVSDGKPVSRIKQVVVRAGEAVNVAPWTEWDPAP
jgi:uncharacterized protein (TIGR03000 family)